MCYEKGSTLAGIHHDQLEALVNVVICKVQLQVDQVGAIAGRSGSEAKTPLASRQQVVTIQGFGGKRIDVPEVDASTAAGSSAPM